MSNVRITSWFIVSTRPVLIVYLFVFSSSRGQIIFSKNRKVIVYSVFLFGDQLESTWTENRVYPLMFWYHSMNSNGVFQFANNRRCYLVFYLSTKRRTILGYAGRGVASDVFCLGLVTITMGGSLQSRLVLYWVHVSNDAQPWNRVFIFKHLLPLFFKVKNVI